MKHFKLIMMLMMFFMTSISASAQTTIIPFGDTWKYKGDGTDQGAAWRASAFNDAAWSSGAAPLGYRSGGAAPQPTTVMHSTPLSGTYNGYVTYYYRKTFNIPAGTYTSFTMKINRDDGFALWINGTRYTNASIVGTDTAAFDAIALMSTATAPTFGQASTGTGDNGTSAKWITLPASAFLTSASVATSNCIAIEMHNTPSAFVTPYYYSTSSDIWFDFSLAGNTNVPTPTLTRGSYMVCPTYNSAVTGTITTTNASTTIGVQAGYISNLAVGMTVAGTGVGTNARITAINTALNQITVSVASTATGSVTGTFDSRCLNTVQFRTSLACVGWVKFGLSTTTLNTKVSEVSSVTNHTVVLPTLSPNTKYFYSIGYTQSSVDYTLEGTTNNYFWTPPVKGDTTRTRFWVTGDGGQAGSCANNMTNVRNAFNNYCTSQGLSGLINGWIWLGDNAYDNGTDAEYTTSQFGFSSFTQVYKGLPVFPSPGNHDYYANTATGLTGSTNNPTYINGGTNSTTSTTNYPYFDIFSIPSVNTTASGTEKYWSQDYGNIHMISLDSYGSIANSYSASMMVWLKNDLIAARNNPKTKFIIAFWHHPPYSKGGHNSNTSTGLPTMRNFVNPLLEKYGVDLVMCGHSHQYERTNFIKGHFLYNADTASGRNQAIPLNTPGLEEDFRPYAYQDSIGTTTTLGFYPSSNEVSRPTETRVNNLNTNDTYSKTSSNGTIYLVCGWSGSCDGRSTLCSSAPVDSNLIMTLTSSSGATNWHWGKRQWPHNADRMPDQLYGSVTTNSGSTTITVPSTLTLSLVVGTWVQDVGVFKGSATPVIPNGTTITAITPATNTVTLSAACTATRSSTNPLQVRFEKPSIKAYSYGTSSTSLSGGSLLMETYYTPSTGKYNLSIKCIHPLSTTTYRILDSFIIQK